MKFALMALILASLEDYSYQQEIPPDIWLDVKRALQGEAALYVDLVRQWSAQDGGGFMLSPRMRSL